MRSRPLSALMNEPFVVSRVAFKTVIVFLSLLSRSFAYVADTIWQTCARSANFFGRSVQSDSHFYHIRSYGRRSTPTILSYWVRYCFLSFFSRIVLRVEETGWECEKTCMSSVLSGSTGHFDSTSVSLHNSRPFYSARVPRFIRMTHLKYLIPWYGPVLVCEISGSTSTKIYDFSGFFLFIALRLNRITKVGSLIVSSSIDSFPGIEWIRRRSETKRNYMGVERCVRHYSQYNIKTQRVDVTMRSTTAVHYKMPIKMIIRCWKHAEIFSVYFSLSFAVWNPDAHVVGASAAAATTAAVGDDSSCWISFAGYS